MRTRAGRILAWAAAALALALGAHGQAAAFDLRLLDAATGAGVPDGIVTLDGAEHRASGDGTLHLDAVPALVLARAPGYRAARLSGAEAARSGGLLKLTAFEPRALYLSAYGVGSGKLRNGALDIASRGGANALVVDLKGDRGIVPYPSAVPLTAAPGVRRVTTIRDLPAFVSTLHARGLYLIARIVVFKDDPLAGDRPDLAVRRMDGRLYRDREGLAWTDPFQPQVRAYNIDLAVEAARAGFDEIQFDYLRFPDSPAHLLFARPASEAARIQAIAAFLAEARRALVPFNVFLAADIFGYVCWNTDDTGIGQRLEEIMPQVDYLSPMLYPSGFQYGIPGVRRPTADPYAIVHGSLVEAQRRLKVSPKRFRPWLQGFRDYAFDRRAFDADAVAAQTRAAEDFGSDGWMLWNPQNIYSAAGLGRPPPRR